MSIIRIQKRDNPFAQIDKRCLNDDRLTWGAKGILLYLISKPDNWEIRIADLQKRARKSLSSDKRAGREFVQNCMKELQEIGYATLETVQAEKGQLAGRTWVVSEIPAGGFPDYLEAFSDERVSRLSADLDRRTEKPTIGKTDNRKTRSSNNNRLRSNNEPLDDNEAGLSGENPTSPTPKPAKAETEKDSTGEAKKPKVPQWMVESFDTKYKEVFGEAEKFGYRDRHFGDNGFKGLLKRLDARAREKARQAGDMYYTPSEIGLMTAWNNFLKVSAEIEWVRRGFFTPTDLFNQFDKIIQDWKSRKEKEGRAAETQKKEADKNGAAYWTDPDTPVLNANWKPSKKSEP